MSRLTPVLRAPIPVVAHTLERAQLTLVSTPEVGLRWGQSSRFEFGGLPEPEDQGGGVQIRGNVDDELVIQGEESYREYVRHTALIGDIPFEVEGVDSVTFFLGERQVDTEEREYRRGVTYITPIVETLEEYLKFDFNFQVAGERGEPHPPETPEFEPAKFYRVPKEEKL